MSRAPRLSQPRGPRAPCSMRPAKALERPPCRTGASPSDEAAQDVLDAAGEGAGAPAVPNRGLAFRRGGPGRARCGRRGRWSARRAEPGPRLPTRRPRTCSMRPARALERPPCRTGASPSDEAAQDVLDAAGEGAGAPAVPTGVLDAGRGRWSARRAEGPRLPTRRPRTCSMRPARALERPPCRTGASPSDEAAQDVLDAAGEGAGAPAVPNRGLAFRRGGPGRARCGRRGRWSARRAEPGPRLPTRRPRTCSMRPARALERPPCRAGLRLFATRSRAYHPAGPVRTTP